jgi:hypothetical protein
MTQLSRKRIAEIRSYLTGERAGAVTDVYRQQCTDMLAICDGFASRTTALEDIALLDDADGHELTWGDASRAVGIATKELGKHPSQIFAERFAVAHPLSPDKAS